MVLNDKGKDKLKRRPYPEVHVPLLLGIFIISKKKFKRSPAAAEDILLILLCGQR